GHDRVVDLGMGGVSPPGENVGAREHLVGEAMLGHVQGGGAHVEHRIIAKPLCDALVHALRINPGNDFVAPLVDIFSPNGDTDHRSSVATGDFSTYVLGRVRRALHDAG